MSEWKFNWNWFVIGYIVGAIVCYIITTWVYGLRVFA